MGQEQSSHYYREDGSPQHYVVGKNGKNRGTTIKDARALHLYPSVTTILKCMEKPMLTEWKLKQVALAVERCPRKDSEEDRHWFCRLFDEAFKQVEDAADLGTNIHAALEAHFSDQPYDKTLEPYVLAVDKKFQEEGIHVMQRELTIVNKDEGYAGKTDLLIDSPRGLGVGDYKTRKSKPEYKMEPWDEQPTQVAAYVQGQFGEIGDRHTGFNLFVSTTEPGRVEIAWYDAPMLRNEWTVFRNLCEIWRIRNGYDPRQTQSS